MLLKILIIFFVILIASQLFLKIVKSSVVEGLENNVSTSTSEKQYQPYNLSDPNNALILAQQNAGNIEVLKGRIDGLDGVKERVDNLQQSIDSMQTQMNSLVQQQADYAQEMVGSEPITVTGTDEEKEDN
jgi:hypothetical protein